LVLPAKFYSSISEVSEELMRITILLQTYYKPIAKIRPARERHAKAEVPQQTKQLPLNNYQTKLPNQERAVLL